MTKEELAQMSENERNEKGYKTCSRCGGTGKYSYCTMYGDVCFKCNGIGFVKIIKKTRKPKTIIQTNKINKTNEINNKIEIKEIKEEQKEFKAENAEKGLQDFFKYLEEE